GGMVIGQQEAAGAETGILGLQERLREDEVGRGMRLPWCGVVFADPGLLIAELVEPSQRLQGPVLGLLQAALRRMRWHRKISEFHGSSSRCCSDAPLDADALVSRETHGSGHVPDHRRRWIRPVGFQTSSRVAGQSVSFCLMRTIVGCAAAKSWL